MMTSLDGYVAGPDGDIALPAPEGELHRHFNDVMRQTSIALCGRRLTIQQPTYQSVPSLSRIWEGLSPWEPQQEDVHRLRPCAKRAQNHAGPHLGVYEKQVFTVPAYLPRPLSTLVDAIAARVIIDAAILSLECKSFVEVSYGGVVEPGSLATPLMRRAMASPVPL
jgi:hypothetical protein